LLMSSAESSTSAREPSSDFWSKSMSRSTLETCQNVIETWMNN
jgi:hypothetical protein